ncbi:helix-turn-helix domain-containing protein, partial [Calditerricola satsumensis]
MFTERFPGIRPWARRTERAEALLLQRLKAGSFRRAAQESGTSTSTLRRLLFRCVGQQINLEEALRDVDAFVLSIDEHSYRGRDMMVTVTCV